MDIKAPDTSVCRISKSPRIPARSVARIHRGVKRAAYDTHTDEKEGNVTLRRAYKVLKRTQRARAKVSKNVARRTQNVYRGIDSSRASAPKGVNAKAALRHKAVTAASKRIAARKVAQKRLQKAALKQILPVKSIHLKVGIAIKKFLTAFKLAAPLGILIACVLVLLSCVSALTSCSGTTPSQNAPTASLDLNLVNDGTLSLSQQELLRATNLVGYQGSGRCAMWTNKVFQAVTGVHPACNACDYLTKFENTRDFEKLQVGMFIAVKSTPYTALSRQYGHVGIYIGAGKVMHNAERIRVDDLDTFFRTYGGWNGGKLWGWGWANNKPLV